jgi:superfamily I DNA/RNA helicase
MLSLSGAGTDLRMPDRVTSAVLEYQPRSAAASGEQLAAFSYTAGNAYVGAGPGTGKTFLLVERYRFLRDSGIPASKILVLTFSRRAALELRVRLVASGVSAGEIDVRTFHGFSARVIGGGVAAFRTTRLLDGVSRHLVLDAAIERTPTPALANAARSSRALRTELETLLDCFGRAPALAGDAIEAAASPRLRDVLAIVRWSAAARSSIGSSDIGDLVSRAVREAGRPDSPAARWLQGRYAHVLVDEFQDTDRVQLDLIGTLGAVIFAVGDEAQSIYRFRGASNDIVAEGCRRFAMERFDLTVSRRCPPDICAVASQTPIPGLRELRSAYNTGAPVEVVRLRAVDDEVAYIADSIEAALMAGTPAPEIAVLLRSFRPLGPLLIDELRGRSIAVASTGREELLADPRIRTLRAALDVLHHPEDAERWRRLLASPPLRYNPVAMHFAGAALQSLRLDASLGSVLKTLCRDGALSGMELAAALLHAAKAWRAGNLGMAARRLTRGLGLLAAVMRDEAPSGVSAAAGRLKLVCDALASAQRTALALHLPAQCGDLVARFDEFLPGLALDDAGINAESNGVRVLTVHAAKGLEFKRVFVADAVAGRFPQDARASTLLTDADREWLVRRGFDGPALVPEGAVLEEASLWYVALTRCKDRLTITFANHALNGDLQRPSRFIPADRVPADVTIVNRESLAMRGLRSADAAARACVVGSNALAEAPAMSDFARLGADAFSGSSGLPLHVDRGLSVGDAELWLQCPRSLFYKKFAKLPDDESSALVLGSALHDVLQRFHTAQFAFDAEGIDVDGWTRELLALRVGIWDALQFASPVLARAAANAADIALGSYARLLGERARAASFSVEAREQAITIPAGRFSLSGRVDRVDVLADNSRVVVDYKLGHAKATTVTQAADKVLKDWRAADVAGEPRRPLERRVTAELKLQLAFYAIAFENVSSIAYVYLGGADMTQRRNGAVIALEPFAETLREVVAAALLEIETGLLAPLEDGSLRTLPVTFIEETCTFCPYRGVCPGPTQSAA